MGDDYSGPVHHWELNEAAGATTDIGCEHRNVVSCP